MPCTTFRMRLAINCFYWI